MPLPTVHTYEIRVERHLGSTAAALFPGFEVRHEGDGSSVLTGALPDQAALHGALARVLELGLVLVEVRAVADTRHASPGSSPEPDR